MLRLTVLCVLLSRVFKRATPRLNVLICLGTFLGFSSTFGYSIVLNYFVLLPYKIEDNMVNAGLLAMCNVSYPFYLYYSLSALISLFVSMCTYIVCIYVHTYVRMYIHIYSIYINSYSWCICNRQIIQLLLLLRM